MLTLFHIYTLKQIFLKSSSLLAKVKKHDTSAIDEYKQGISVMRLKKQDFSISRFK